jgi:hypothetical protein
MKSATFFAALAQLWFSTPAYSCDFDVVAGWLVTAKSPTGRESYDSSQTAQLANWLVRDLKFPDRDQVCELFAAEKIRLNINVKTYELDREGLFTTINIEFYDLPHMFPAPDSSNIWIASAGYPFAAHRPAVLPKIAEAMTRTIADYRRIVVQLRAAEARTLNSFPTSSQTKRRSIGRKASD